ncbi:MAG: UvrD-helicase domain-containing protein, partial [Bryobacterales bacterium]|nr:UvrD-helicase domain-containing protein [Bryobacterales bacterium]
MIADNAARLRALDISQSFIVQAPAGSGKTELLIQRYLKLLGSVEAPDAVVAITFTRKAAGEMRSRVIGALRAAERGQEPEAEHEKLTYRISRNVLKRERQLGWNLLRNPARLRIETIDALCAAITRRMPWLSRFGAMPEISEKAGDLYREAARNTLSHLSPSHELRPSDELGPGHGLQHGRDGLAYILLHLDNDFQRARQLISQMLESRDQWLRHTGANPDFTALRKHLEDSLERVILGELVQLRDAFAEDIAGEIALLRELKCFPEARMEDLESWAKVSDLLLTKGGDLRRRVDVSIGFPAGHPLKLRCEQLLTSLRGNDNLLERLKCFRELPPRFSETQWEAVQAAVSVLT